MEKDTLLKKFFDHRIWKSESDSFYDESKTGNKEERRSLEVEFILVF